MTPSTPLSPNAGRVAAARRGPRALARLKSDLAPPAVAGVLFITGWHIWATSVDSLMIATPWQSLVSLTQLLSESEIWNALWVSNQAFLLGFAVSTILAVPLGLAIGRFLWLERMSEVWLNVMLITPMAMILPLIVMAFGFSLTSRAFIVFLFAFPIMVVNCRTGIKSVDTKVIEMTRSFGGSELQIWRHILLPGASPAIWVGIRLGIARGISGMLLVEMLLVGVGVGAMLLRARGLFEPGDLFAIVAIIVVEAMVLVHLARAAEKKLMPWSPNI